MKLETRHVPTDDDLCTSTGMRIPSLSNTVLGNTFHLFS